MLKEKSFYMQIRKQKSITKAIEELTEGEQNNRNIIKKIILAHHQLKKKLGIY